MKLMNFSSCRRRYQILATWNSLKVDGKPIRASGHAGSRPIIRPSTLGSPAIVRKDFHNSPGIAHSTGQSEVFTTLMFWFSFQPWALAWGVLLQVCLQTCLLTLFQRLCFRRTLCFYGMWRRLFPDASRFSLSPPSPRQIQHSVTTRSALHQFSKFASLTPELLPLPHIRCLSRSRRRRVLASAAHIQQATRIL